MSEQESTDSFLTVAEVATLLKLNQQTVRNWIDAGSLPAVRIGRRVRIPRSALQQLIASGTQGSVPGIPTAPGPSAHDFWGGEPVGGAEPDPEFDAAGSGPPGSRSHDTNSASSTNRTSQQQTRQQP